MGDTTDESLVDPVGAALGPLVGSPLDVSNFFNGDAPAGDAVANTALAGSGGSTSWQSYAIYGVIAIVAIVVLKKVL